MNIGTAGITLLQGFETLRLKAYKATPIERYFTIGWGHCGPDVKPDDAWTQDHADAQLVADLATAEGAVNRAVTAPLTQNQFDALVCLAFNIGVGAFEGSTLVKYLNLHKYQMADSEFLRWNKQAGVILIGLVRRRKAERALFLTA